MIRTPWFRALACGLLLVPAGLVGQAPAPARAAAGAHPPRCGGTLLQLQVEQGGRTAFDRFRFELGLEAEVVGRPEPAGKAEALSLLSQRLSAVRTALQPLLSGELTSPAPSTYRSGGGSAANPVRDYASTSVSGVVSKAGYDALIQTAGRLPGVTLRGFTALATGGSEQELRAALLRQALAEGRRQAELTARALGLQRVQLLRIDQRSGGVPRPMPYARTAAASFNPDEAPAPERSLSLALDYCLS